MTEIKITNKSRQIISINVKAPKGDFYMSTQDIRLGVAGSKGSSVIIPKSHANISQIENLAARGIISYNFQ